MNYLGKNLLWKIELLFNELLFNLVPSNTNRILVGCVIEKFLVAELVIKHI